MSSFVRSILKNRVKKFLHQMPLTIEYKPTSTLPSPYQLLIGHRFSSGVGAAAAAASASEIRDAYEPDDDKINEHYLEKLDELRNGRNQASEVETCFEAWRKEGFKPQFRTFERALTALCYRGKKKELKFAIKYLIEMCDKFPGEKDLLQKNFRFVRFHCYERSRNLVPQLQEAAEKRNIKLD